MTTFYEALQRKDKELDLSILNASELEVKLAALPRTYDLSVRLYETLGYINKTYGLSEAERMQTVLTARKPEDVLTKEELKDMLKVVRNATNTMNHKEFNKLPNRAMVFEIIKASLKLKYLLTVSKK